MIIIDYSQVCLASILQFSSDLKKSDDEVRNLIRHIVLSSILTYKKKYSEYGQIVIACDGRNYWRKDVFPYYKACRKKNRDKSDLNWTLIFNIISEIKQELIDYFPYHVINIDKCEADDIIAVLSEWSQTNDLVIDGFDVSPQKVMIISSDGDFLQLQQWNNINQFSPNVKKLLHLNRRELHEKKITHIVKGDSGDGIPSILNKDDVLITEGVRQTPVSAKRLAEFIEQGKDACRTDEERRNWDRNEQLVSFDKIPDTIKQEIIDTYINCNPKRDAMKIMNFLMTKKCRLLLDELNNF